VLLGVLYRLQPVPRLHQLNELLQSDVELQGAFHLAQLALVVMAPGQAFANVSLLETFLHLSCCEEDFYICQVIETLGGSKLNGCVIKSLSKKVLHKHSVKALLLPQLATLPWILSTALFQVLRSGLANLGGAIPNFATEKEQKRNFLDFTDVTLVVVDIKSERFVKSTCLQQDLFDITMVTIMFDTKTSESESFIDRSIEGIINIMMEFHHF
jgi:hypothetical protein